MLLAIFLTLLIALVVYMRNSGPPARLDDLFDCVFDMIFGLVAVMFVWAIYFAVR